ncbi:MAG: CoxG family protein [Gammaproteobacteria bacterium]
MKFGGERLLHASPAAVFAALNDAEVLRRSIPGCESLDKISGSEMRARVKLKIGPVNAAFNGKVALSDINPPHSYTIGGGGDGGAAGSAKGEAKVQLQKRDDDTLLIYEAEVQISGKIAQLGARLMDGVAKQIAAKFFDNFAAQINPPNTTKAESAAEKQNSENKKPPKVKMFIAAALIIGALAALFAAVN